MYGRRRRDGSGLRGVWKGVGRRGGREIRTGLRDRVLGWVRGGAGARKRAAGRMGRLGRKETEVEVWRGKLAGGRRDCVGPGGCGGLGRGTLGQGREGEEAGIGRVRGRQDELGAGDVGRRAEEAGIAERGEAAQRVSDSARAQRRPSVRRTHYDATDPAGPTNERMVVPLKAASSDGTISSCQVRRNWPESSEAEHSCRAGVSPT